MNLRPRCGLTLIEMLIALAILAILLAMAYPTYTRHVQRVQRAEALEALLSEATRQEQRRAVLGQYTTEADRILASGRYTVRTQISNQGKSYLLTAVPQGSQRSDPCGELGLNDQGIQTAGGETDRCWAGR